VALTTALFALSCFDGVAAQAFNDGAFDERPNVKSAIPTFGTRDDDSVPDRVDEYLLQGKELAKYAMEAHHVSLFSL